MEKAKAYLRESLQRSLSYFNEIIADTDRPQSRAGALASARSCQEQLDALDEIAPDLQQPERYPGSRTWAICAQRDLLKDLANGLNEKHEVRRVFTRSECAEAVYWINTKLLPMFEEEP